MNEFQFRCFNGQFLTASDGDVISATADSPGDSETFYIERNNTLLHIKLLNGSYLRVLFLLCSEMEAVMPCHYIHCDETRTNSLTFRNNVQKVDKHYIIQVTDNNQLTSNYPSQPGWDDAMATFEMTIVANNLHGDYQLANGYGPVKAKSVLEVKFQIHSFFISSKLAVHSFCLLIFCCPFIQFTGTPEELCEWK